MIVAQFSWYTIKENILAGGVYPQSERLEQRRAREVAGETGAFNNSLDY